VYWSPGPTQKEFEREIEEKALKINLFAFQNLKWWRALPGAVHAEMREVLRQRARSCDGAELAVVPRPRPSPVLDTPGSRAGAPAPALGRGE